jgi:hypothetical protein
MELEHFKDLRITRQYHKEKVRCSRCGSVVTKYQLKRHQETNACATIYKILKAVQLAAGSRIRQSVSG